MPNSEILKAAILIILTTIPFSLIIVDLLHKFFFRYNKELGEVTTICTNISRTLTKKNLAVQTVYYDQFKITKEDTNNYLKITNIESKEDLLLEMIGMSKDSNLKLMASIFNICKFAKVHEIEKTITDFFLQGGLNGERLQNEYELIEKIPAEKGKKISTVVVKKKETEEIFGLSKGHPKKILERCNRFQIDDKKQELTQKRKRKIRKQIERLIKSGQKVIACAYKPLPIKQLDHYTNHFAENELVFLGLVGVTEPLRNDLQESIEEAKEADIKTYILTGIKEKKAIAIAQQLEIINSHYFEAITGDYLRQMSDNKVEKLLANREKDYVFAEMNDDDKQRLVKILGQHQKTINISTNGIYQDYKEVIKSIKNGRIIESNSSKYIQHSLVLKAAQIFIIIASLIFRAPLPFSLASILLLEMVANLALEIPLRTVPTEHKVMIADYEKLRAKAKAFSKTRAIIKGLIIGAIASFVLFMSLMQNGWAPGVYVGPEDGLRSVGISIIALFLIAVQIFRALNYYAPSRSIIRMKFLNSPHLSLTAVLTILIVYITTRFPISISPDVIMKSDWGIMFYGLTVLLITEEIRKFIKKHFNGKNNSKRVSES